MLANQQQLPTPHSGSTPGLIGRMNDRSCPGHYCQAENGEVHRSDDAYTHPQPHVCFIQSVQDDLVRKAGHGSLDTGSQTFKYGSGTGSNFSDLRGGMEPLSGGGVSSGVMSFSKLGTRQQDPSNPEEPPVAAKMVCLDIDHPISKNSLGSVKNRKSQPWWRAPKKSGRSSLHYLLPSGNGNRPMTALTQKEP